MSALRVFLLAKGIVLCDNTSLELSASLSVAQEFFDKIELIDSDVAVLLIDKDVTVADFGN